MKIPVFLPVTREFGFRDEFAQDCLLQRRVHCEPDFDGFPGGLGARCGLLPQRILFRRGVANAMEISKPAPASLDLESIEVAHSTFSVSGSCAGF